MVQGHEGVTWPQWRDVAAAAERHGFEGLFCSDHYLSELPGSGRAALETWGVICALAAVTSRIRLGSAVTPASFRHPSVLAKLVATADQVSGGRVELGIGAGWYEREHLAYGFPFSDYEARMDVLSEQLELIVRSWREEPFSFEGRHFQVRDLNAQPKPLQHPGPPIILGGNGGPRSVELAARFADEYNTPPATNEQVRDRRAAYVDACERAGHDPDSVRFSVVTPTLIAGDRSELHRRAAAAAGRGGDGGADPIAYLEQFTRTGVAGSPEEVVERLEGLRELGAHRVLLEVPDSSDLEMIELIGTEVLPRVGG